LTLLQGVPNIEPMLGPWGTLAGLAFGVAMAYIAHRANLRAKTAEAWESTAKAAQMAESAAKSEMETHRNRSRRLEEDNMALAEENGRLKAMTDLSALSDAFVAHERRDEERHAQVVKAQADNTEALLGLHKAILGFQSQVASVFETMTARLVGDRAGDGHGGVKG
jgi:hypothetical protein